MKLLQIGVYRLGLRYVRVFLNPDEGGGSVRILPDDKGGPRMTIGVKHTYEEALSTLLHEAYELTLVDLRTRYAPEPMGSEESSDFLFIMHHNELGRAHEQVAYFLSRVIADFSRAYTRLKKARKK